MHGSLAAASLLAAFACAPRGQGPRRRRRWPNFRAVLEGQGLGMDRVVRCSAMLADMAEWPAGSLRGADSLT
jgi:hypothetical protein